MLTVKDWNDKTSLSPRNECALMQLRIVVFDTIGHFKTLTHSFINMVTKFVDYIYNYYANSYISRNV